MSQVDLPSSTLRTLIDYPNEDLNKEYKSWLDLLDKYHQAVLAQAMLALANHGGGYVISGFDEKEDKKLEIQDPNPDLLSNYNQDVINEIVEKYADPSFHCSVYHIKSEENEGDYPVIVVPGPHIVPIRAKKGGPETKHLKKDCYYIRRPGPISEPPQTGKEWDELIKRCIFASKTDLLDNIRIILTGTQDESEQDFELLSNWMNDQRVKWVEKNQEKVDKGDKNRYQYGVQYAAYRIIGDFEEPSRKQLLEYLAEIDRFGTVFPMWMVLPDLEFYPRPIDDVIEAWNYQNRMPNGAHSEYWRASPKGMLFSLRGYFEDYAHPDNEPLGTLIHEVNPIYTVGMTLLHSHRLLNKLGCEDAEVEYIFTWTGLKNRTIITDKDHLWGRVYPIFRSEIYKSHEDFISVSSKLKQDLIMTNLQEHVHHITMKLYESFGFYEISKQLIEQKVNQLLNK